MRLKQVFSVCSGTTVDASDLHLELGRPRKRIHPDRVMPGGAAEESRKPRATLGVDRAFITPAAPSVSRSQAAGARVVAAVGQSVPGFVLAAFPGSASN